MSRNLQAPVDNNSQLRAHVEVSMSQATAGWNTDRCASIAMLNRSSAAMTSVYNDMVWPRR